MMNLANYATAVAKLHELTIAEPGLAHFAHDVGKVRRQAEALADGERKFERLSCSSTKGIPTLPLAKKVVALLGETGLTDGTEDQELLVAIATVQRNLTVCLVSFVLRDYAHLVSDSPAP